MLFSILLVALAASTGYAQTSSTENTAGEQRVFADNLFGVGLHESLCSGMGLSFKHHIAQTPIAYSITGGAWKTQDITLYDFGFDVQYDLSVEESRLYAVAGFGHYYSGKSSNEREAPTRFGAGIGYEIPFMKRFGLSIDIMITSFQPTGDILPLPSLGTYIYFK